MFYSFATFFVPVYTHVTSNLLENMLVSMGAIQSTLNAFLAPYPDKSSRFFGTPAATHVACRRGLNFKQW